MTNVYEILQKKGPYFNIIDASAKVIDAITMMKAENLSYMIVFENNKYVGIFSERDYAHKVILENKRSDIALVKEIMTINFPLVASTDKAEYCMQLMNSAKTRYLPVFDGKEFKGVITIHDLMRESIAEHEKDLARKNFAADATKSEMHYWI